MKLFGFQFTFHFDDYCVQKSFAEDQPNMNSASSDFAITVCLEVGTLFT